MKTKNLFLLIISLAIVAACSHPKTLPDPVLDLPVQHGWEPGILSVIDSISSSPSTEAAREIISRTDLTRNILNYLDIREARVQYYIIRASAKDTVRVTDISGAVLEGFLRQNQLLVKITTKDGKSRSYFVRCMNGMVDPINDSAIYIGELIYTLAEGEGPMSYGATYEQVWSMCTRYHLQLAAFSRDKRNNQKKIKVVKSLTEFRKLSAKYPIVKINSLQPGDRFRKNIDGSWDYLK